jgi:hypothetical protein
MEARVTDRSQSYRLEQRAREAQVRHGEEVRADIPNIRVATAQAFSGRFGWPRRAEASGEIFFCEIGRLRVREIVVEGDDAPLPSTVVVEGLGVPMPGHYDLVNVLIRTNGDLRLIIDAETRLEPAAATWSPSLSL